MALPEFYIALDTETGGTRPVADYSLLEVGAVLFNKDGIVLDELELAVAPEGGIYRVTAGAMRVNGIDLVEHAQRAVPAERAAQLLTAFVAPYNKPVLVGWNVGFDRDYIAYHLIGEAQMMMLFNYRSIDLHAAMNVAALADRMPYTTGLEATARFFGLLGDDERQEHRALGDTHLTVQVFNRMRDFIR